MAAPDRGPVVIGISVMFETLAFIVVALRLWTLHLLKRRLLVHDMLLLTAFVLTTALVALVICTVKYGGMGKHAVDLATEPEKLLLFGKLLLADTLTWVVAMTFARLSILSLYVHIFSLHTRFRVGCYILIAATTLWGIAVFILLALDCHPFAFNWDKTIPGGYCVNIKASYLSAHVANLTVDSSIAFLPAPVLWGLQMPLRKKIAITVLFALGATICIFSLVRIALYRLVLGYDSIDFTWTAPTPIIFTVGEPSLGCIIACLPLLRPVTEKLSSMSVVSWIKLWSTGTTRATKNTNSLSLKPENIDHDIHATAVAVNPKNGHWQRLSEDQTAIMVNVEFDRSDYEMKHLTR
ncbi:hypothetical protein GGR58DRAFT_466136 [Xylaria digitata]|nr:hypothetical protein GGR58DRAFT_466136 [Xylaria digitata]